MSNYPTGYKLLISIKAKNALKDIPKSYQKTIIYSLEEIQEMPLIGKPLTKERMGQFSYKAGKYRIVYRVNKKNKVIQVLTAGFRSKVYE